MTMMKQKKNQINKKFKIKIAIKLKLLVKIIKNKKKN